MYQGQGKQLTVERFKSEGAAGETQDFYQFSYDHGNRMYSDYMKKLLLFSNPEISDDGRKPRSNRRSPRRLRRSVFRNPESRHDV